MPAFDGLSLSGALEVEVTVGGTQSVELSGDENVLPLIRTRVVKGALVVDSESSGACNGTIKGISGKRFTVDVSGASSFELTGTAETVGIDLSGSGAIGARGLEAPTVSASVSGAGQIELTATSTLAASVSGVGSIEYWGKPGSVSRNVSGVGSIEAGSTEARGSHAAAAAGVAGEGVVGDRAEHTDDGERDHSQHHQSRGVIPSVRFHGATVSQVPARVEPAPDRLCVRIFGRDRPSTPAAQVSEPARRGPPRALVRRVQ